MDDQFWFVSFWTAFLVSMLRGCLVLTVPHSLAVLDHPVCYDVVFSPELHKVCSCTYVMRSLTALLCFVLEQRLLQYTH